MQTERSKTKVYVAMSGGVDSSVAAALLVRQGYDVTGVYFKPWSDQPSDWADLSYCNWQKDRQDAMRVAVQLGITFKTWDVSKEYGKLVAQYMIDAYKAGITPNPDVMCNKEIKFGIFLKKALAEGADYIATGHYARLKQTGGQATRDKRQETRLLKARDTNKDQAYFLYTLTQEQLKHTLFPIGEYTKPEVRKLAKKFDLPTATKKDSQGVCFVGTLDMKEFLKKYIKPLPGPVKLIETGETIGTHDGVYYYTIGQRHGLDLGIAGGPFFVVKKDIEHNIIYVSAKENDPTLNLKTAQLTQVTWIETPRRYPLTANIKIRYRTASTRGRIVHDGDRMLIEFDKPVRAITPGQSAVFYKGSEVLGGGIIVQ